MTEPWTRANECQLINADCLQAMPDIPDGSVDMVLADVPYGTTACKWDTVIPFEPMWEQLKRVTKPNGAIVLTASQPFTSALIMSNVKMFKYEWIWEKDKPSNFALANRMPLKYHESVCVFYKKQCTYNKKMQERTGSGKQRIKYIVDNTNRKSDHITCVDSPKMFGELKNPSTIQKFSTGRRKDGIHPTQKPVALMEYLIKTYTNEGETVLDFTMGSGTTGVACANLNRSFIGIEMDADYFALASKRIQDAHEAPQQSGLDL
jgi:site-specific DNA-methyltransferase (adenine-specific)